MRPSCTDVELELCLILLHNDHNDQEQQQQKTTIITLRETEDELLCGATSAATADPLVPKRLLTLKDYSIQNGSFINLAYRGQQCSSQSVNQPNNVYQSMNNEYSLYGSGVCSVGTMRRPLVPQAPPPQLPSQHRYHLENTAGRSGPKQLEQQQQLLTFSSSTASSSSSSSPTGGSSSESQMQVLYINRFKREIFDWFLNCKI